MDASTFRAWIREAARLVVDNADHLTHLDAAIGDADHGINLRRGFQAAVVMLDETDPATPAAVLATVGRAMISKTGGASGPLYGTGFRQAAKSLGEDPDVTAIGLGAALRAALDGIQQLGAANEGDKTMVDALAPAVGAYQTIVDTGGDLAEATRAAADAAARGLQAQRFGPFTRLRPPSYLAREPLVVGAAFGLQVGERSPVIAGDAGFFIIESLGRKLADSSAWLAQRDTQRAPLLASARQARIQQYMEGLRARAQIVDRRKEIFRAQGSAEAEAAF